MANVARGPVASSCTMPRPQDDADAGPSGAQAVQRLAAEGPNTLPGGQRRTLWAIAAETVRERMFLLLLSAGALYLAFGDLQEGLTLYQEGKTEPAVEALRDLTSPRARVIRDGQPLRVAGRDRVRGDIGRIGSALGGRSPGARR
jgi:Ca2+-transporting ATPase